MSRSDGTTVSVLPVVSRAEDSARTGQKTAKLAAEILCDTNSGFVIPTASQREAILIAFVRAGFERRYS